MSHSQSQGALFLPQEIESALRAAIESAENILCVSHVSPDGDAIGSLLGMGWILRHLGKEPTLALADKPSLDFGYIPGFDEIVGPGRVQREYDLIICLDAGSRDRMGSIYRAEVHGAIPLAVIDHHKTNTRFGSINWVEPRCAAVCQMLVYLADALGAPLRGPLAVALLTGLITDTLCFRTSSTNEHVLEAATRLTEGGASIAHVVSQTLQRRSYTSVRLWGTILSEARVEEGVIWSLYPLARRKELGAQDRDTEGLANFLLSAKEADISATFSERVNNAGERVVECSFRAKPGFDVSQVAVAFGGGGHAPAAGCRLTGSLDQVAANVVAALRQARREQVGLGGHSGNGGNG